MAKEFHSLQEQERFIGGGLETSLAGLDLNECLLRTKFKTWRIVAFRRLVATVVALAFAISIVTLFPKKYCINERKGLIIVF